MRAGELDEDPWTDRYRGGWQLAAPTAGNAAQVEGVEHGFHGGASEAHWIVTARSAHAVDLALACGPLRFEHRLELSALVRNEITGKDLRLRWDETVLPHVWVWYEARTSGGRWRGAAELLGIEPAMVPHSLGLAEAIASGHARMVTPDVPLDWWLEAEPLSPR